MNYTLLMSFFIYEAFGINAKRRNFIHFAYFVIAHCRTSVLSASRFLVCVHFRSSVSVSTLSTRCNRTYSTVVFLCIEWEGLEHWECMVQIRILCPSGHNILIFQNTILYNRLAFCRIFHGNGCKNCLYVCIPQTV